MESVFDSNFNDKPTEMNVLCVSDAVFSFTSFT